MINIGYTTSFGNSFQNCTTSLRSFITNDGFDNLRQGIAFINTYNISEFTESEKLKINKIIETFNALLDDLYSEEKKIKDRKQILVSLLEN